MKIVLEPNVNSAFKQAITFLRRAGSTHPQLEADWIFEKLAGYDSLTRIKTGLQDNLPQNILAQISDVIERRMQDEPLAYILKEADFYGISFYVDDRVLIPRPETEHLVDWALKWAEQKPGGVETAASAPEELSKQEIKILDMGTGSGCVGLTLLKRLPHARLTAIDVSGDALEVARQNALILGLDSRVRFIQGEAAQAVKLISSEAAREVSPTSSETTRLSQDSAAIFDIVVANPPYIAHDDQEVDAQVTRYEPHVALFGDDHGLKHIQDWAQQLDQLLKPDGATVFEFGSKQGEDVRRIFNKLGIFSRVTIHKDYAGYDRYVSAER